MKINTNKQPEYIISICKPSKRKYKDPKTQHGVRRWWYIFTRPIERSYQMGIRNHSNFSAEGTLQACFKQGLSTVILELTVKFTCFAWPLADIIQFLSEKINPASIFHPKKGVDIPDCNQIVLFLCQNKYFKGPSSETQSAEPQEMIVNNQLSLGFKWINTKLEKS